MSLKGAVCFRAEKLMRRERSSSADFFFCLNNLSLLSCLIKLKKADLKGRHDLYWFTLFRCGGPCHLSLFKQCYFSLRTACLFTYGQITYFSVCIITSLILQILTFWVWISSSKLHSVPKVGANKCLNETSEVVGDIKHTHARHRDSSTHKSIFTGQL